MRLLDPWLLALALLVPLVAFVRRMRRARGVTFAPGPLLDPPHAFRSWRVRLRFLPGALEAVALLLVVFALARPVELRPLPHATKGLDIVLCLDTSSSMAARDLDPDRTRLDVARDAAARFVARRGRDRIGLVRFARYPDVVCPPTLDHDALAGFLADLEQVEGDGPEDATGIGAAVARAAQLLRAGESKSRVVILLTDGEENVATADRPDGIAPVHAGQLCRELGVRVYAVGAGLDRPDRDGRRVPLDTRPMRKLAAATGGRWFEARDAGALDAVYAAIDRLETVEFIEPRFEVVERFVSFLGLALALAVSSRVLRATVLGALP